MTPGEFADISTAAELAAFLCAAGGAAVETAPRSSAPAQVPAFDAGTLRADFPALAETVHGRKLIYLDNAAIAQVPAPVLEAVHRTESARGNIHRGVHALGDRSTRAFEKARETCAAFLGTDKSRVTFTAGTTDGINRAARSVRDKGVVVTAMEHHSNFVPWQQRCRATGKPFRVCPIRGDGTVDRAALDRLLDGDIGILAVTQMSNVLGMENPVAELCAQAHERGIRVLVDGAQSACHLDIDVEAMGCDWFVCSGHKLGGPFGVGLLYSREPMPHTEFGGGMVDRVTEEETTFLPVWEAGTPPVSGAAGMAAAIEYRASLPAGWQEHEAALLRRAEARLREIPGLRILGAGPHIGCLSVAIEDVSAFDAAVLLDQMGIALRSGSHCAQPLHRALGLEYSLRISPAYYNTPEEIDALGDGLWQVVKMLRSRS